MTADIEEIYLRRPIATSKDPGKEFQLRLEADDRHLGTIQIPAKEANDSDAFHPTHCPICSGDSLKKVHCFTAKQTAEAFFPLHRDERRHNDLVRNIEGLWRGPTCEVVECGACRFTFPIPYVAGNQEFYELAYGLPSYPGNRWEYGRAIKFLEGLHISLSGSRLQKHTRLLAIFFNSVAGRIHFREHNLRRRISGGNFHPQIRGSTRKRRIFPFGRTRPEMTARRASISAGLCITSIRDVP